MGGCVANKEGEKGGAPPSLRAEQGNTPARQVEQGDAPAPREKQSDAPAPREKQRDAPAPREKQRDAPAPREKQRDAPAPRAGEGQTSPIPVPTPSFRAARRNSSEHGSPKLAPRSEGNGFPETDEKRATGNGVRRASSSGGAAAHTPGQHFKQKPVKRPEPSGFNRMETSELTDADEALLRQQFSLRSSQSAPQFEPNSPDREQQQEEFPQQPQSPQKKWEEVQRQQQAAREHAQERLELEKTALIAKCDQVFEAIDRNGDGILTRAEVIKGLKSSSDLRGMLELEFDKSDINLRPGNHFQQTFERVFQSMDVDSDKSVTKQEFKDFCVKKWMLSKANYLNRGRSLGDF